VLAMNCWPPEELDVQTVDMERWLPFQFLTSLLRFGSGWFANQSLQPTPVSVVSWRSQRCHEMGAPNELFASRIVIAYAGHVVDPAWLSFCR